MRTKNIIKYLFLLLLLLVSIQVISATNTSNTSNDTNIAQPPGQEKQNITATY